MGVDVFFVISGFLISTIILESLNKDTFTFSEFYSRRIRRIFPALILVLVASYVVGWIVFLPDEYKLLGRHIAGGAGFASNFVLWREAGYFDRSAETKPLLHLWSLGIEEQFYITWPLLLWIGRNSKYVTPAAILIALATSFYLNVSGAPKDPVVTFYFPFTRAWELLCGSLLAWLTIQKSPDISILGQPDIPFVSSAHREQPHRPAAAFRQATALTGLLLLVCAVFGFNRNIVFPGWWALVPVVGAMLLISAGPDTWISRTILSCSTAVWIGLISFPLYLWHWPLLSFAGIIEGQKLDVATRAGAVSLAFVLSWLSYEFIERPIRKGGHGGIKAGVLAGLMALIACGGYLTDKANGFAFRFSPEIRPLVEKVNYNWKMHVRYDKCYLQKPLHIHHDPECIQSTRPLIALWGDSHAASLYPGLKHLQEDHIFGIAQLTQAACPPLLAIEKSLYNPYCKDINADVFNIIASSKPDILLLHSAWSHPKYPLSNDELYSDLRKTIRTIKQALPSTRIIVIGPVPRWNESPQKASFLYWRQHKKDQGDVPVMQAAAVPNEIDSIVRQASLDAGADFVSAVALLCDGSSCISRVGNQSDQFIATDEWHFSKAGSEFFLRKLEGAIFTR